MKIVTRSTFNASIDHLTYCRTKGLDTETTGLRPYHGDRLFSVIICCEHDEYYYNFKTYPQVEEVPVEQVLTKGHLESLKTLFDNPNAFWRLTNAKYDMHMLGQEGLEIKGEIWCTKALGRVEYNEHWGDEPYGLEASLARIGLKKDDGVEKYIQEHKLYEKVQLPGKKQKVTLKHFDQVPFRLIVPYACNDTRGSFVLGQRQEDSLNQQARSTPEPVPSVLRVLRNEQRLTKTIFHMEKVGVRIDREYTLRASRYELDRSEKARVGFKRATGRDYADSGKLFAELFASERDKWEFTDKGNPSFTYEALKKFENEAAKLIVELRDAKAKADFYNGFLYHADSKGDVHPNVNPDGARHGRCSSSNPNFQNLTSEDLYVCRGCKKGHEEIVEACEKCGSKDLEAAEFHVRRAIVPRPGFVLIMPDYIQMEYVRMLERACALVGRVTPLAREVNGGKDVHQATADLVTARGTELKRSKAKNGNFALLFGSGDETLAWTIGGTKDDASALRAAIFDVAPEIKNLIFAIRGAARTARNGEPADRNRFIFNWLGRRCYLTDPSFAYKFVNYLISGDCADINKVGLNEIDDKLQGTKSRLIMTIHDENPCEVHESEVQHVPLLVKRCMEGVIKHQYVPLYADMAWSEKSLADKRKGFPV